MGQFHVIFISSLINLCEIMIISMTHQIKVVDCNTGCWTRSLTVGPNYRRCHYLYVIKLTVHANERWCSLKVLSFRSHRKRLRVIMAVLPSHAWTDERSVYICVFVAPSDVWRYPWWLGCKARQGPCWQEFQGGCSGQIEKRLCRVL